MSDDRGLPTNTLDWRGLHCRQFLHVPDVVVLGWPLGVVSDWGGQFRGPPLTQGRVVQDWHPNP
jgi:hypothetical protein